jgi:hypothetical protein
MASIRESRTANDPIAVVDQARYPIAALGAPAGKALVADLRARLTADGMCVLPGFLTAAATRALAAEGDALRVVAYRGPAEATAYYGKDADGFPADHPRRMPIPREMVEVAYDQIANDSGLKRLYHCDALPRFLAAVLCVGRLYRYADPYQAITLSITPEGSGQNWHFDDTDFIVTLMLQAPERGGAFECVANLRSDRCENYDGVKRILEGSREGVVAVPFNPGSMMIFQGLYALHQVAPVSGRRARIIAVFSFDTRPGLTAPAGRNAELFGPRVLEGA